MLECFASYLKDITVSVHVGKCFSSCSSISYGAPKGSILGPLLFALYIKVARHVFLGIRSAQDF